MTKVVVKKPKLFYQLLTPKDEYEAMSDTNGLVRVQMSDGNATWVAYMPKIRYKRIMAGVEIMNGKPVSREQLESYDDLFRQEMEFDRSQEETW